MAEREGASARCAPFMPWPGSLFRDFLSSQRDQGIKIFKQDDVVIV